MRCLTVMWKWRLPESWQIWKAWCNEDFLKKLDTKVYNGDYEVPVRLYFPNEEALKTETSQGLAYPILLFFMAEAGWQTVWKTMTGCAPGWRRTQVILWFPWSIDWLRSIVSLSDWRIVMRQPGHFIWIFWEKIRTRSLLWETVPEEIWQQPYVCLPETEESLCQKTDSDLSGSGKLLYRGVSL